MNKTVLITGATSGIGLGCARKFADNGDRLILTGRNEKRLEAVCDELKGRGHARRLDPRLERLRFDDASAPVAHSRPPLSLELETVTVKLRCRFLLEHAHFKSSFAVFLPYYITSKSTCQAILSEKVAIFLIFSV